MNFATLTLGELLSHKDAIIKRNALSILKQLQKERDKEQEHCGQHDMNTCTKCLAWMENNIPN